MNGKIIMDMSLRNSTENDESFDYDSYNFMHEVSISKPTLLWKRVIIQKSFD